MSVLPELEVVLNENGLSAYFIATEAGETFPHLIYLE